MGNYTSAEAPTSTGIDKCCSREEQKEICQSMIEQFTTVMNNNFNQPLPKKGDSGGSRKG
jgi:hypothetical protein